jgi:AcrB/AcrD/AcrF family
VVAIDEVFSVKLRFDGPQSLYNGVVVFACPNRDRDKRLVVGTALKLILLLGQPRDFQDNVEEGLSGVKGANSVKIVGRDLATLEAISQQVLKEMASVEGVTDLGIFPVLGQPNLNIKVNRDEAARYGLNAGDINNVVQAALGGTTATTLLEADRQFGVTVRLTPEYRGNFDAVRNVKVSYQTPAGTNAYIPLSELAEISLDTGASYIYHERNERFIPIKFSVRGRDLGSTVAAAQRRIAQNVKLPIGYRIAWAGEFEELQQAKARLEIIVPISLLMILVLLYGLFNSLRDSLLALAGIPFAAGGGILALYLTGQDFSISAAVGFVSLFGVSVMNGILIMTYFHEIRTPGISAVEAMFHAASQRMRPMLMTALSACIGLLPAAVSTGIGSQVQRPLATVVVGGMFLGPIILLIVVPAVQTLFLDRQRPRSIPSTKRLIRSSRKSHENLIAGIKTGDAFLHRLGPEAVISFVLNLALHQKRWALTRSARRQLGDRRMARFAPKLLPKLALGNTECATRNGHWPTLARFFGNHGMRLVSVKECTRQDVGVVEVLNEGVGDALLAAGTPCAAVAAILRDQHLLARCCDRLQ